MAAPMQKVISAQPSARFDDGQILPNSEAQPPLSAALSEGMGLSLPIVRRITDLLGHHITVGSVLGKGSCFQIEVPIGNWKPIAPNR